MDPDLRHASVQLDLGDNVSELSLGLLQRLTTVGQLPFKRLRLRPMRCQWCTRLCSDPRGQYPETIVGHAFTIPGLLTSFRRAVANPSAVP